MREGSCLAAPQDAFGLLMKLPTAANARLTSSTCSGQMHRSTEGTGLPSEHPSEGTGLPSERPSEGTGLRFEHPSEGTSWPSGHPSEGSSQLPFVHRLLSLHMDKLQQGQLLQAWLSAGGGSAPSSWQKFLGQCSHAQVMHSS